MICMENVMKLASFRRRIVLIALLGFFCTAQATDLINDDKIAKLKDNGVKQIVIPYFKVNIHTKLNKTARASSGLFGGGNAQAKSAMFTEWAAPDLDMLQKVADAALPVFEQQLIAAGFEVVPTAKVITSEAYKKINGSSAPVKTDNMVSLAPAGLKVYEPGGKIDPNGSFFLGMANMNQKLEPDTARELLGTLDGVAVLRVTLNLAYGDFDVDTGSTTSFGSTGLDAASAKVGFVPVLVIKPSSPTVTPEITGLEFHSNFESAKLPDGTEFAGPRDFSRLTLNSPLVGDTKVSALTDVTTNTEKAATASVALLGMLMGKGASLEAGKYKADVDGAAFAAEAQKSVTRLAAALTEKLKTP